uniref:uncharacterized protein C7orf50-like isoform X2 n=1 Tax=Myxine glutinosa TaxID=7769 RepID=UPI00358ED48B
MPNTAMRSAKARKRNDSECCEYSEIRMSNAGSNSQTKKESFEKDMSVVRRMELNIKKMDLKVKHMEIDMRMKLMEMEMAEMKKQKLELEKSDMLETDVLQQEELEMNTPKGNCMHVEKQTAEENVERKKKKKRKKKPRAEKLEKERKKEKREKKVKRKKKEGKLDEEDDEEMGKRRSVQTGNDIGHQEGLTSPPHHEDAAEETMETLCDATTESMSATEQYTFVRKMRKEKMKELRRKAREAGEPIPRKKRKEVMESFAKDHALDYLKRWKESKDDWKFSKTRQVWLLKNMFNISQVPEDYFSILLEYIKPLNGLARNETIEKGKMLLKQLQEGKSQEDDLDPGRIRDVLDALS